jgi:hypothetical protein
VGVAGVAQGSENFGSLKDFRSLSNLVAVLTLGERWAELCMVQGRTVQFARSLGVGATLAAEVKRSLAVFAGTAGRQGPQALYVAGDGDTTALRESLQTSTGLPVQALDPFAREEAVKVSGGSAGVFAAPAGLLRLWGQGQRLPIDLLHPKEARPAGADAKRRRLLVAALVGLVFLVGVGLAQLFLQSLRADRDHLVERRANQQERLKRLQEDVAEVAALKEWEQTSVRWLDELYDLAARMDQKEGFRLTRVAMNLTHRPDTGGVAKKGPKDPHIGNMELKGVVPVDEDARYGLLRKLTSRFEADKHVKVRQGAQKTVEATKEFTLNLDLLHQSHPDYAELLPAEKKGGRP